MDFLLPMCQLSTKSFKQTRTDESITSLAEIINIFFCVVVKTPVILQNIGFHVFTIRGTSFVCVYSTGVYSIGNPDLFKKKTTSEVPKFWLT